MNLFLVTVGHDSEYYALGAFTSIRAALWSIGSGFDYAWIKRVAVEQSDSSGPGLQLIDDAWNTPPGHPEADDGHGPFDRRGRLDEARLSVWMDWIRQTIGKEDT